MYSLCLVSFVVAPARSLILCGYRTPTASEAVLLILLGRSKDLEFPEAFQQNIEV